MKDLASNPFRIIPVALALLFILLANDAGANYYSWDPIGTSTQSPFYTGSLSQTWENSVWASSTTTSGVGVASPIPWADGNDVIFAVNTGTGTPAFTVTMNANHTVTGIFDGPFGPNPCPVTISGSGTIILPSAPADVGLDVTSDTGDPGSLTINNVIAGSPSYVEWEGSGSLVLNGANTFSCTSVWGFLIATGGGVSFGNNAAFGTATIVWGVAGFLQPAQGGTAYNIANKMTHTNLVETFAGNSGGVTFSGAWTLPSSGTTTLANYGTTAHTITVSGAISGAAALTISTTTANYGNPWTFTGANTFSGPLTIAAGTLTIGGSGKLTSGGTSGAYSPTIANSGTFAYASSASQTLSGIISGTGALTNSAGTLTLSAANSYTGATAVGPGTLNVSSTGSLAAGSTVTVYSGGTLSVAGAVNGPVTVKSGGAFSLTGTAGGTVTVNSGGTLSTTATTGAINGAATVSGTLSTGSGHGNDVLNFGSSLALSGATTTMQLNGTNGTADLIDMTGGGTVTLGGTLTVANVSTNNQMIPGNPAVYHNTFTLFAGGTLAGSGFSSTTLPALLPGLSWNKSGLAPGGNGEIVVQCDGTLAVSNSVSAGSSTTICNGSSTTLTATPSGGSGTGYTYSWSPGGATNQSITVSPTTNTTYTVTVADAAYAACTATSLGVNITVYPLLTASAGANQSISRGGSAPLGGSPTAGGGSGGGYTYLWSPSTALTPSAIVANPAASPAATTLYTVTVTDGNGCTATNSVTVTVTGGPPQATNIVQNLDGSFTITGTGVVGTPWSLNASPNVTAPLPWPSLQSGSSIPSNPFTVNVVPGIGDTQQFYYLTNNPH